jgi:hypothetical protein
VKENTNTVFRWLAPPGVRMKATLKENSSKLDPDQFISIRRDEAEIAVEVSLPPLKKGRGVVQPAFGLSLFVQAEADVGFKFLASYILQVKT